MMEYTIRYTDSARADLRDIAIYLTVKNGDKTSGNRFVDELQKKCEILKLFPESGSIPKDDLLKVSRFRFLVHKGYLIFYRFNEDEGVSYITAIFNAKQDYFQVMSKFI